MIVASEQLPNENEWAAASAAASAWTWRCRLCTFQFATSTTNATIKMSPTRAIATIEITAPLSSASPAPSFARWVSSIQSLNALPKSSIPRSRTSKSGRTRANSARATPRASDRRILVDLIIVPSDLRVAHGFHPCTDLVEEAGEVNPECSQDTDRRQRDQRQQQCVLDEHLTLVVVEPHLGHD